MIGAGVSVINDKPKEIIYCALSGINLKLLSTGEWIQYIMTVDKLQVNVPSKNAMFKILLQTCEYTDPKPMTCEFCNSLNNEVVSEGASLANQYIPAIHSCAVLYNILYLVLLVYQIFYMLINFIFGLCL